LAVQKVSNFKTQKMKLFSTNITKRELTFVKIGNILHIGSHNGRVSGKKIFIDFLKKSFEITLYKEAGNENNGQAKRYFGCRKTTDAMGYSIDVKIPFFFIMFRSHTN
jgi:hypothetical protein